MTKTQDIKNSDDLQKIIISKVGINDICAYNEMVHIYSLKNHFVGKSYTTPYFNKPEALQKKQKWEYSINKYGFRGADWTFEKSPAFFGCSFTFGSGVEVPISEHVAKALGIKVIPNLGVAGGGVVNIIKIFAAFTNIHPLSDAIIILPHLSRKYLPSYDTQVGWRHQNYLGGFVRDDKKRYKQVMNVLNDNFDISYSSDYIDWAIEIAKNKNINLHWATWSDDTASLLKAKEVSYFMWNTVDSARDLYHPGIKSHKLTAKTIIDRLSNKDQI
jgi:hypothetical protein